MTARCEAILISLLSVAQKHQRFYCWISQKRLEELVERYHKIGLSNRTLNRDLRWLEENGYISRLRRIRVGQGGKLVYCSSLYKFTGKLFNWLNSVGKRVKKLFSFFRLPKLADHCLRQKQDLSLVATSVGKPLLITEKDGSVSRYYPGSGVIEPA
jgi:DNA-binding transcriptional ArsR family regulator